MVWREVAKNTKQNEKKTVLVNIDAIWNNHEDSDKLLRGFAIHIFADRAKKKIVSKWRLLLPSIYRVRSAGSIGPKGFLIIARPSAAVLRL